VTDYTHTPEEDIRKKVMDEINFKIKAQRVINTTNSVFLLLLKEYLIDNDYDVSGFGEYVMKQMHLSLTTYRAVCGRLNLRTLEFNRKEPPKEKGYRRSVKVVGIKEGKAVIYTSGREAERKTGVCHSHISKCCLKKHKQMGGYYWFYLTDKKNWVKTLNRCQTSGAVKTQKHKKN